MLATAPELREQTTGQLRSPMTTIRKQLAAIGAGVSCGDRARRPSARSHRCRNAPVNSVGHPLGSLCLPDVADISVAKVFQGR